MSIIERDVTVPSELRERVRQQETELERLREQLRLWEEEFGATPAREALFSTSSGIDVEPLYTPADRLSEEAYTEALGVPGRYPFTRGSIRDHVSDPPLDDAAVRRVRHRRGDEPAVQIPA